MDLPQDIAGKKILVVDDEVDICELLAENLEDEGFDVKMANCGNDAIEIVKNSEIDLVITDVRMPNGDGVFLLDEIRKINPHKPAVVFITGYSDLSDEDAYKKGIDGIFHKPLDFTLFLHDVRKYLVPYEQRVKRKHPRKDSENVVVRFNQGQVEVDTKSVNVSEGGIFIRMSEILLKVGDVLDLELGAGETDGIKGQAVVRWLRREDTAEKPSGIGVEFIDMDEEKIKDILSRIK
jgi:DNA-binding response OmpR family regulator